MTINGKTHNNNIVVGNVFQLIDTKGVPLEVIVSEFTEFGYVIDWIDFYESSIKSGWNMFTSLNKIEYSLSSVKGEEYSNRVMERLRYYIMENGEK